MSEAGPDLMMVTARERMESRAEDPVPSMESGMTPWARWHC